MLVGVRIKNFDVFDDDKCGLLMEDYIRAAEGSEKLGRPLLNLNALIGRNRTGKTSFFTDMHFLKRTITENVASASTGDDLPGFSNLLIDKTKPAVFEMYFNIKPGRYVKKCFIEYDLSVAVNIHGSPYIATEKVTLCNRVDGVYNKVVLLDLECGKGKIARTFEEGEPVYDETEIADTHTCAVKLYGGITSYTYLHA